MAHRTAWKPQGYEQARGQAFILEFRKAAHLISSRRGVRPLFSNFARRRILSLDLSRASGSKSEFLGFSPCLFSCFTVSLCGQRTDARSHQIADSIRVATLRVAWRKARGRSAAFSLLFKPCLLPFGIVLGQVLILRERLASDLCFRCSSIITERPVAS